jgi:hypothetical protein
MQLALVIKYFNECLRSDFQLGNVLLRVKVTSESRCNEHKGVVVNASYCNECKWFAIVVKVALMNLTGLLL